MTSSKVDTNALLEAAENRRTIYALSNEISVPEARIKEIIEHAIKFVPSAFNTQSTRIIALFKKDHEKLWDITKDVMTTALGPERVKGTLPKLNGFQKGFGTVCFLSTEVMSCKWCDTSTLS